MSFSGEDEFYGVIEKWLEERGLATARRLKVCSGMELDIAAVGSDIFGQAKDNEQVVYVIEGKLAHTPKLIREAVEEAILRLAVADYVLIATPYRAVLWVSSKEQKEVIVANEVLKRLQGRYTRRIGLIAVDKGTANIVKNPKRSRLYIPYARELVIKEVLKRRPGTLLRYKK